MNQSKHFVLAVLRRLILPLLPRAQQLPARYRLARWAGELEPELQYMEHYLTGRHTAVDVGANVGFYSLRMSGLFQRVLAFEPNDEITRDLQYWNPGNVEIRNEALSSVLGESTLRLPWVNGRVLAGWASLESGNLPEAQSITEKPIKTAPLDHWEFDNISFIKIDVEGHELSALHGATQTVRRCRPVVLIEVRKKNESAVAAYFRDLNYAPRKLSDYVPVPADSENYIYVPR
jgi:FkbM family methyltransferase